MGQCSSGLETVLGSDWPLHCLNEEGETCVYLCLHLTRPQGKMQDRSLLRSLPLPVLLKVQMWPDLWSVCDVSGREPKRAGALVFCSLGCSVGRWGCKQGWGRRELSSASSLLSGRQEAQEPKTWQHCLLEYTEHVKNHCSNDKYCNKYWQDMNPASAKMSFLFSAKIPFFFSTSF